MVVRETRTRAFIMLMPEARTTAKKIILAPPIFFCRQKEFAWSQP